MKSYIVMCSLGLFSMSCRNKTQDTKPDSASQIAGSYTLTSAYFSQTNTKNPYKYGSLTISRVNADSVRGDVKFEGVTSIPFSGNWKLMPLAKDTIRLNGGNCGCQYADKQVVMNIADATIQFIFEKDN